MKPSTVRFGAGGAHPPTPQHVWSPAGGWWVSPPNWKRNTAVAFGFIGCCFTYIFFASAALEERPVAPKMNIPSRFWAKVPPVDED